MHSIEHELRSLSYACNLVAGALGLRMPHPRRREYFSGLQCDIQDHPSHPSASNLHEVKHCAAQQGPWLHNACVQGTAALCLLPRSPRKASSSQASGRPGRRTCCCSPWTSTRAGERRSRVYSANGSVNKPAMPSGTELSANKPAVPRGTRWVLLWQKSLAALPARPSALLLCVQHSILALNWIQGLRVRLRRRLPHYTGHRPQAVCNVRQR